MWINRREKDIEEEMKEDKKADKGKIMKEENLMRKYCISEIILEM